MNANGGLNSRNGGQSSNTNTRSAGTGVETGAPLLELKGLDKKYPDGIHAVKSINYQLPAGSFCALLGPNGAGKSTTMGMICGLCLPTRGEMFYQATPVSPSATFYRRKIGVVSQHCNLELDITALQNMKIHGLLYGIKGSDIEKKSLELLERAGLKDRRNSLVRNFSGGMRRRLQIIRALLHDPELIMLDEPTTGLDPSTRENIWDLVLALNRAGKTVLFSTHYMEEAEQYARHISVMHAGKIIADGTSEELIDSVGKWCRISYAMQGKQVSFFASQQDASAIQSYGSESMEPVAEEVIIRKSTLNDVFISITGNELRQEGLYK